MRTPRTAAAPALGRKTSWPGHSRCRLPWRTGPQASGVRFLIDTGTSFSIIPHSSSSPPTGPLLHTADGCPICCWGSTRLQVSFQGRSFTWDFLLAAISFLIIGVDFLCHFKLWVDAAGNRFLDSTCWVVLPADKRSCDTSEAATITPVPDYSDHGHLRVPPLHCCDLVASTAGVAQPKLPAGLHPLLYEFLDVLNAAGRLPPCLHGVEHHLETTGRPVTAKLWLLDGEKLQVAEEEFARLKTEGIIWCSNSCWASPLHMVKQADGSWRPCRDFRRVYPPLPGWTATHCPTLLTTWPAWQGTSSSPN